FVGDRGFSAGRGNIAVLLLARDRECAGHAGLRHRNFGKVLERDFQSRLVVSVCHCFPSSHRLGLSRAAVGPVVEPGPEAVVLESRGFAAWRSLKTAPGTREASVEAAGVQLRTPESLNPWP